MLTKSVKEKSELYCSQFPDNFLAVQEKPLKRKPENLPTKD